tara:strand:+ start:3251 stop:4192 length:942 start_codon:yes stop_codon:yes gene_type:complete
MFEINPWILFVIGASLLYFSSDILVSNSIIISEKFNIPRVIIGGTVIALGTSLPEIIVSIIANLKGNNNMVIGNIIGSNIANICLVFGVSILYKKIYIKKDDSQVYYNMFLFLLISTMFYFIIIGGNINKIHGISLIFIYVISFLFMIKYFKTSYSEQNNNYDENNLIIVLKLILGSILIYSGSNLFIDGAIGISALLGIYELSIGMTIVAFGTSAPELVTSLNALKKDEHMLIIGNIIGSNIANIIFAAGISSLIKTIYFNYSELIIYNYLMLLTSIAFILIIYFLKNVHKTFGLLFISIYFIFIYLNFYAN